MIRNLAFLAFRRAAMHSNLPVRSAPGGTVPTTNEKNQQWELPHTGQASTFGRKKRSHRCLARRAKVHTKRKVRSATLLLLTFLLRSLVLFSGSENDTGRQIVGRSPTFLHLRCPGRAKKFFKRLQEDFSDHWVHPRFDAVAVMAHT